jgi:murein DD-endopeptidase MepM/ murein hydrolase activator NlpD
MADISSIAWDYKEEPITQGFGVYNPSLADWYGYAADYGWAAGTHIGLDIGVPKFTPIYAVQPGQVKAAGPSDSFRPNPVTITEDDGDEAIYGHLWSDTVTTGQRVKRGDLLGYSGEQTEMGTMTPDGSGPHLHFELRRPDRTTGGYVAVDPTAELTDGTDRRDPTNDYGSNPYTLGYSLDPGTAESLETGGKRLLLGLAGGVVAILGVWVLAGMPKPPKEALALLA